MVQGPLEEETNSAKSERKRSKYADLMDESELGPYAKSSSKQKLSSSGNTFGTPPVKMEFFIIQKSTKHIYIREKVFSGKLISIFFQEKDVLQRQFNALMTKMRKHRKPTKG